MSKKQGDKNKNQKPIRSYCGPFPINKDLLVHETKKIMHPAPDGPTADLSTEIDTTLYCKDNQQDIPKKSKERPSKEDKWYYRIPITKITIWIFCTIVTIAIGYVISHESRFVSVEKDVEYLRENNEEQKTDIKETKNKVNEIDKKVDLIEQKIDFQYNNTDKR
ncbi:MAG: hypothetical protein M0P32_01770 [Bacteroidales bacterium]|nr:hypothetical protein [Bacteroidales bacterium]MDD2577065.1 hypothetical protein [Bacteroidales bacterium]MDD3940802.1 hypothetical protein [Candidatus Paceibacterota bacterium]